MVATGPVALASLLFGGHELAEAMEAHEVQLEGDTGAFERYLRLFSLPAAAAFTRQRG